MSTLLTFMLCAAACAINVAFYADGTHRWWNLAAAVFCGFFAVYEGAMAVRDR